jgi:hypothetical protein
LGTAPAQQKLEDERRDNRDKSVSPDSQTPDGEVSPRWFETQALILIGPSYKIHFWQSRVAINPIRLLVYISKRFWLKIDEWSM